MPKLPVLSAKDVIKVLTKSGFLVHRQTGSHIHLWNEDQRLLVTVPKGDMVRLTDKKLGLLSNI